MTDAGTIQGQVVDAPPVRLYSAEAIVEGVDVFDPGQIETRVEVVGEGPESAGARHPLRSAWETLKSGCEWTFGLASLIGFLAALATFPLLQFMSLGYLLEASGRIARSGRFRDGFVGVRQAARLGGIALSLWLLLWPVRLVADLWYSAQLIDPQGGASRGWRVALVLLVGMLIVHASWALFRGGRLRHFFWPAPIALAKRLVRGGMYAEARDRLWNFVVGLRLPQLFWLGLRGFAGAVAWLFIPVVLTVASFHLPPGPAVLAGLIGALLLPIVVLYLPFLQAQFACEGRLVAMFDVGGVRRAYARAPIAFWTALATTLLFALPLYLLKIEFIEREVAWLPSLVFVVFILPARLVTGWAVGRGRLREAPRWWPVRWSSRLAMIPIVLLYVLFVYLTRYVSWYGSWSLFEQHAFLLPVPFLGV